MIEITERASEKAKELIGKQEDKVEGLKLQVFPGGCSGYIYNFSFIKEAKKEDEVIKDKGIKFFIDKNSLKMIKGSKIDYLDTLQGAGFIVMNPNAAEKCHCGKSFN